MRKMVGSSASVGKPSALTLVLGAAVGLLQLVNQIVLTSPAEHQARDVIAVVLAFAGSVGISALFGPALLAALQVPPKVLLVLGAALAGATGLISVVAMSTGLHAALATALTLIGAELLGSPIGPVLAPIPPGPAKSLGGF